MLRSIVVIVFAFIFSSCSNNSENTLAIFRATQESLQKSNEVITASSIIIYQALDDRLSDPRSATRAEIWQPKAKLIEEKTAAVINYIDTLINKLKEESGLKEENFKMVFNEEDKNASARLFLEKKKGIELYERLKKYKKDMLAIDIEMNKVFGKNALILTKEFENDSNKQKEFTNTFFKNSTTIGALIMLTKFENNAKVMENKFVEFCLNKTYGTSGCGFEVFNAIIGQNSNYLKAGDNIEISAGVGVFSVISNPKITINGKVFQPPYSEGVVSYKFKTPLKAGKYFVPIKIEYIGVDGTIRVVERKAQYTVIE